MTEGIKNAGQEILNLRNLRSTTRTKVYHFFFPLFLNDFYDKKSSQELNFAGNVVIYLNLWTDRAEFCFVQKNSYRENRL